MSSSKSVRIAAALLAVMILFAVVIAAGAFLTGHTWIGAGIVVLSMAIAILSVIGLAVLHHLKGRK